MITADEARGRAGEWAARGRTGEIELGVYEFDLGYVLWVVEPLRADPSTPPELGAARAVVDKQTGELSTWPSLPAQVLAARYREAKRAPQRFSERVLAVLRDAGWSAGRDVTGMVDQWFEELRRTEPAARELALFPAARAALAEFGRLTVKQYGPTGVLGKGFDSVFHPAGTRLMYAHYADLATLIGEAVFPLAVYAGDTEFVIDTRCRVFLLVYGLGIYFVAETLDGAVTRIVEGFFAQELPPVDDYGRW